MLTKEEFLESGNGMLLGMLGLSSFIETWDEDSVSYIVAAQNAVEAFYRAMEGEREEIEENAREAAELSSTLQNFKKRYNSEIELRDMWAQRAAMAFRFIHENGFVQEMRKYAEQCRGEGMRLNPVDEFTAVFGWGTDF